MIWLCNYYLIYWLKSLQINCEDLPLVHSRCTELEFPESSMSSSSSNQQIWQTIFVELCGRVFIWFLRHVLWFAVSCKPANLAGTGPFQTVLDQGWWIYNSQVINSTTTSLFWGMNYSVIYFQNILNYPRVFIKNAIDFWLSGHNSFLYVPTHR